jgi:HAD superfamily 5'-nucleotidase-like hydrolase
MISPLPLAVFSLSRLYYSSFSRISSVSLRSFSSSLSFSSTASSGSSKLSQADRQSLHSQIAEEEGSDSPASDSSSSFSSPSSRHSSDFPSSSLSPDPFSSSKDLFNYFLSCLDSHKPFYNDLSRLRSSASLDRTGMIFSNNECSLHHVQAVGMDYDHTVAAWASTVDQLLYNLAKKHLIDHFAYPRMIDKLVYDPTFPIRGLMWDSRTGFLLKLDQFLRIQTSCVVRGRHRVSIETILHHYNGISVSQEYLKSNLHLMSDLFSASEICLLGDLTQNFIEQSIEFSPEILYQDIRNTFDYLHTSGLFHSSIMKSPQLYLEPSKALGDFLMKLRQEGKKIFLITNSGYPFVDCGMRHMLKLSMIEHGIKEENWLEYFDVAIFTARKPSFWTSSSRFREIDIKTGQLALRPANEFRRGHAYSAGGLKEFTRLMKIAGSACLYLGDHVSADLVLPAENALWKTGAVVKEIAYETEVMASPEFRSSLRQLLEIESLIDYGQRLNDEESKQQLERLKTRRSVIRRKLLRMFNANFGSVFRTSSPHRTLYFAQLCRVADIYMSSIGNFLNYPLNYCWYPSRSYLPHEATADLIFAEGEEEIKDRLPPKSS